MENMMIMKNPIALCVHGGLRDVFKIHLLGLINKEVIPMELPQGTTLFGSLEKALDYIDTHDFGVYTSKELKEMNERRVSFFLKYPLHPSFMHTSFEYEENRKRWWGKLWPIGYLNDNTLANEFVGTLLSGDNTCELRFHQDICAVEVRRKYEEETEFNDGFNFLKAVLGNHGDLSENEMKSLLETFGSKVGRLVAEANNTHLDIRPPNILLKISRDKLERQDWKSLRDYEVKLIDWAHCRYGDVSENLEEFELAIFGFEKSIVSICWSKSFEEMKLVVNCVLNGFILGFVKVKANLESWIKGLYLGVSDKKSRQKAALLRRVNWRSSGHMSSEITRLELRMDLSKKWKDYHKLKSLASLKRNIQELRVKSLKWGFYSHFHNPLAKLDEPKKWPTEELKDFSVDFSDKLCVALKQGDGGLTPKIVDAPYRKFIFEHEEFIGSRWVHALCLRKGFQVTEYDKDRRLVTLLGRKDFNEYRHDFRFIIVGTKKVDEIEMDINAFIPPLFENNPLNLSNCYVPRDDSEGKSLFHMSEENLVGEIERLRKLEANFESQLEEKISKFKNDNLAELQMKDQMKNKIGVQNRKIEKQNRKIVKLNEKITEKDYTIEKREKTIEEHPKAIKKHQKIIKKHEMKIKKHEMTIEKHESDIKAKDDTIEDYKKIITEHANDITSEKYETDIKAKDDIIKAKDDIIKVKDDIIKAKDDIIEKHKKTVTKSNKEIEEYKKYKKFCIIGIWIIAIVLVLVIIYFVVTSLNQTENLLKKDSLEESFYYV
eukprot:TRINITY_DN880_c0_g1_i5.p1 TRINITY_DN880_c0_g1~~TRINITY_DN880_c0_g1_i5.p1  ORF type:complete len:773 (-),score=155.15 TRINITY_DN880_c0_g1_i5:152-2470(-)